MNINTILKKSWQILWNYRALWLFGAVLALVGAHTIILDPWPAWENNGQWTYIKLSEATTIRVPGVNMTIDLTGPGGIHIINENDITWSEFIDVVNMLDRQASINLWPILIEFAVISFSLLLLGLVARYITETALMRMVNETEETGKSLSLWQGLLRGFSFEAGRLFLLDLAVGVLAALAFIVILGLAITPILLANGSHEAILITASVGTFGLLVLAFFLWLAASAVLSMVLQPIRRLCVLEKQSLLASIRLGVVLTKHHLKEIAPLWLVWMGLRLLWVPFGVLILILFVPFLLLTIPLGIALGGMPAVLMTGITALFIDGATPWIMGALAGLPIFIVVMISPILFVSGLLEVYMSSIWTLAYRDLKAMELLDQAPASQTQVLPAQGTAD